MSARIRTLRAAQSFTATGSLTQPIRRLHITGAKDSPSQLLKPVAASSKQVSQAPKESRTFNTSRALKHVGDSSTIDFAFLPDAASLQPGTVSTAAMNIPILPDTYRAIAPASNTTFTKSNAAEDIAAEVATVSMSIPGQVAILSEVEGATHEGREMDVFKIVETVGSNIAGSVKEAVHNVSEAGAVREIWEGMLGDLVNGGRRLA